MRGLSHTINFPPSLTLFEHLGELEAADQTHQLQASLEEHRRGMQHFSLDGPVFAIVTPFQPGTPPTFDDEAYVKYLQVSGYSSPH